MNETAPSASPPPETNAEAEDREHIRWERRCRWLGAFLYLVVRLIFRTLRLSFENKAGLDTQGKGAIFVTWHGRSLLPANVFKGKGYWALISLSKDGTLQNTIFRRLGFHTVRGSTGRGGVRGALQMARTVKEGGVLAFTPDGPRGPTHKVQMGVILMAEKSRVPIVPLGLSANRRWLIKSWDAFMIPHPFSRAYFIVGEPIFIPAHLDDAGRQYYAALVEVAINRLEREAERRAGHSHYPTEWRTDLEEAAPNP